MPSSSIILSTLAFSSLAISALAAPTPSYTTQYDSGFPICQYPVNKPAYDNKGRGYGWENNKSCIIPNTYGNSYKSDYEPTNYDSYDTYKSTYQQPKLYDSYQSTYEQPQPYDFYKSSYGQPKYSYSGKSYLKAPAAPEYQQTVYQTPSDGQQYQQPQYQAPSYQTPTSNTYQTPTYQQPAYQTPNYDTYQQPSYQTPSYDAYKQPDSSSYRSELSDCKSAVPYFEATGSPTLKQCISIVCGAPGQTDGYKIRGIQQCAALKKQAEATNGGHLPKGW
ncbi:hypothetical protein HDV00_008436 [Rhizophlyctis rosea]|nr:hypothetical protein HDV00_008436 [Rhizophlyctis rosea]